MKNWNVLINKFTQVATIFGSFLLILLIHNILIGSQV